MFVELFKFAKKSNSSENIRLEDFTTESFAALVKMFPNEVGKPYAHLIDLPQESGEHEK